MMLNDKAFIDEIYKRRKLVLAKEKRKKETLLMLIPVAVCMFAVCFMVLPLMSQKPKPASNPDKNPMYVGENSGNTTDEGDITNDGIKDKEYGMPGNSSELPDGLILPDMLLVPGSMCVDMIEATEGDMGTISTDFVDREYMAPVVEYISNMTFKEAPKDAAFEEIFESSYTFKFNYEGRTVKYTFVNKERLEIDGQVIYLTDEKEVMDLKQLVIELITFHQYSHS